MKNFEYAAPRTEAEVLQLLSSEPGKVEILAGGTDLVGLLKAMVVTPERVVNIMEIPSLQEIAELPDGGVSVGATVTLDQILAHPYLDRYPAIKQAIRGINSRQLQCQGTLGGEVCQRPQCWYYRSGRGLLSGNAVSGANQFHAILGNSGAAKFVHASRIAPALIALDAQFRIIGPAAGPGAVPGRGGVLPDTAARRPAGACAAAHSVPDAHRSAAHRRPDMCDLRGSAR